MYGNLLGQTQHWLSYKGGCLNRFDYIYIYVYIYIYIYIYSFIIYIYTIWFYSTDLNFKKFKFYHSTKGHTFSFWLCYIRYALLINDKFPVESSLLMLLLNLSLKTTNRFIHLRHFFTILYSLYFLSWILGSLQCLN